MKSTGIIISLAAVLGIVAISGCQRELDAPDANENLREMTFHAGWADETKTILAEDGLSIYWSPEDSISIYTVVEEGIRSYSIMPDSKGGRKMVSNNTNDAPTTDFIGKVDVRDEANYYAIYPYRSDNDCGGLHIGVNIPTIQTAVAGSFDRKAMVSYAKLQDNNLYFRNLCGGVKFSVSQEGINEVSFRYENVDFSMSGYLYINVEDENNPYLWSFESDSRTNEITVRAPEDSYFEVGKYYYAVMYPNPGPCKLIVTYRKDDEQATYIVDNDVLIKRSVFKRLYNKDAELTFVPYTDGATLMSVTPFGTETDKITEVYFHPSSDYVTENNVGSSKVPVYFELDGTVANYYTQKKCFNLKNVTRGMFNGWSSLTQIDFTGVDTSEATDFYMFLEGCQNLTEVNIDKINTANAFNMTYMFGNCRKLETLDLSSFNTSRVTTMEAMFQGCYELKNLDLSSFDTRKCVKMNYMFNYCLDLQHLDISNFDVSSVSSWTCMCHNLAIHLKQCYIRASEKTKSMMCDSGADMSYAAMHHFITWVSPDEEFPEFIDRFASYYKSTDYSKDKTYKILQTATKGNGIDIIILGDAYSDRLIDNGTYEKDLTAVIDNIFMEYPFKSLREYFNIYMPYVVSDNERYDGVTALDLLLVDGETRIEGGDGLSLDKYIPLVSRESARQNYTIEVLNYHGHAGCCEFYSSGATLVKMAMGLDDADLHAIACHELGHAIGLLADEYREDDLTFSIYPQFSNDVENGYYSNIDATCDLSSIKWAKFISDSRYSSENLGAYEGGFARYAYGVWRPTENSLMNDAATGFNAPSREAIYKRVMSLADDSWTYDYETFVEFDLGTGTKSVIAKDKRIEKYKDVIVPHTHAPIFIKQHSPVNGVSTTVVQ